MTHACALVPSPEHRFSDHPESPERFTGLSGLPSEPLPGDWTWIDPPPASLDDLQRAHSSSLPAFLQQAVRQAPAIIDTAPTYVSPGSWTAALQAAGGALACMRAVLHGPAESSFALVRPPGHHAERSQAMGFCLLNNLAIAATTALEEGLERILIVDYDAHHGNGTQDIFAAEPRAAFVSTHQQHIYPGTGSLQDVPTARGRLVNLPFPAYTGDRGFLQAVDQVVVPLAQRFRPQMLFVSAGFDAHWTDPLTTLGLSTTGYYHLSCRLIELARDLCGGKIVFVLEGGYDPQRLADNVRAVMAAMARDSRAGATRAADSLFEDLAGPSRHPEPDITPLLHQARHLHQLD